MADKLVSVNDNYDFPKPVAERQASHLYALRQHLDIWPAFDLTGGNADSWDSTTYLKYLAGIDAMMAPAMTDGRVVRKQYGTAINGEPLVRFTAGPVNAPHMYLGGGMHGVELVANHAAMRFFQGFVFSDHPAMQALRSRIRITWVPASNPTSYIIGRNSSSGVDINRNFPWGWEYYDNADPDRYKGPAPVSEPETKALVGLFAAEDFRLMFDCHCVGASAQPQFSIAPGGTWLTTNRALPHGVLSRWAAIYNTDNAVTYGELGDGNGGDPTFKTWAAKHLRYDRKHEDAFSMTVEASDRMHGSTATLTTRRALSAYCGYIALLLADWLEAGHLPPTPAPYKMVATTYTNPNSPVAGSDPAIGTPIQDGGQWVNSNTATPFPWQATVRKGGSVVVGRPTYLDVPIKHPGLLTIEVSGYLSGSSTLATDTIAEINIAAGPSPVDGGNVPINPGGVRRVTVPAQVRTDGLTGTGAPFHSRIVIPLLTMPATPLYRVQMYIRRTTGTQGHTFSVNRADITATLEPSTIIDPLPRVDRAR